MHKNLQVYWTKNLEVGRLVGEDGPSFFCYSCENPMLSQCFFSSGYQEWSCKTLKIRPSFQDENTGVLIWWINMVNHPKGIRIICNVVKLLVKKTYAVDKILQCSLVSIQFRDVKQILRKRRDICCDPIPKRIVLFVLNSLFNNVYKINFRHASLFCCFDLLHFISKHFQFQHGKSIFMYHMS